MHPFDWRTILFARHGQHVVLVHFPIALFITAVAFDFLAAAANRKQLAAPAYWNFLAAALTTIPVMLTGVLAWRIALEGKHLKGVLLLHLVFAALSTAFIWIVWILYRRTRKGDVPSLRRYRLALEAVGVGLIAVTGHLGGFLSGVNGP